MTRFLFGNACTSSDNQDAALLRLLWYLFRRVPDLPLVGKQNVSVDAGGVFFVRFLRIKTSEEQGLSLFPCDDSLTCPLRTIALALMVQPAPNPSFLDNIPTPAAVDIPAPASEATLLDLLEALEAFLHTAAPLSATTSAAPAERIATPATDFPTIHQHVNRLLARVAAAAGVEQALSSHSYWRGGAQHANVCADLADRRIFDRGAWNVSSTNKAFNYVFNVVTEDHSVANVLSDKHPGSRVRLDDIRRFDSLTQDRIHLVQHLLFGTCSNLAVPHLAINQQVLDALTASLLKRYPSAKQLNPNDPAVARLGACAVEGGASVPGLAWSAFFATEAAARTDDRGSALPTDSARQAVVSRQVAVIEQFILHVQRQDT